jgi:translation initiation factor 2B subunit (eIF-2B alpha/beta/delta family)
MLAAAAGQQGVPVYIVASRDKFVGRGVAERLEMREGTAEEVWKGPPAGIAVRNPYFEHIPLELVSSLITDIGLLGAATAAEVCKSVELTQPQNVINQL